MMMGTDDVVFVFFCYCCKKKSIIEEEEEEDMECVRIYWQRKGMMLLTVCCFGYCLYDISMILY
jgi:hypothetical protein